MIYDPVAYWTERGPAFEADYAGRPSVEDEVLVALLRTLRFRTVLDVGCGFGRVGEMIAEIRPDAGYTGLDVSPDIVAAAHRRLPRAELICADLAAFDSPRRWDLVIGISVLGFILPTDIERVVHKLYRWAQRDLVTADWDETGKATSYQFAHDYRALLPGAERTDLGIVAMYHVALP